MVVWADDVCMYAVGSHGGLRWDCDWAATAGVLEKIREAFAAKFTNNHPHQEMNRLLFDMMVKSILYSTVYNIEVKGAGASRVGNGGEAMTKHRVIYYNTALERASGTRACQVLGRQDTK